MGWQKFPSDFKDRSAYFREYHRRNKERINARSKAWREANPERTREYGRKWAEGNPERVKARQRKHRHTDEFRAKRRAYKKVHPDRVDPNHYKKWYWQNPEHARFMKLLTQNRRRARQLGAAGTATQSQVEARLAYWGYRCWMCHKPYEAIDHVIPFARGGSNWPANLRPICTSCNSTKGVKPLAEVLLRKAGG